MSGVRGSPGAGFVYATWEGSRAHVYALRRQRWREGYAWFIAGGRLVMRVEPTPEPWGDQHGFIPVATSGAEAAS